MAPPPGRPLPTLGSLAGARTPHAPPAPDPHLGGRPPHTRQPRAPSRGSRSGMEAAARTERPAGWPGAPLARTGLLLLSTWVLAGAEITWGATGGPGSPAAARASRPPALPLLSPRAVAANPWPRELATARRDAVLGRQPRPEPLPQPRGGGQKPGAARVPSPVDAPWGPDSPALGKAGGARRSRRAQPPSALERGDTRATVLAEDAQGSRLLAKGLREEVKAPRAGGAAATEELRLPSTSFALTGDSAHNQAMVHWSGHNSSVSTAGTPTLPLPGTAGGGWDALETRLDSCSGSRPRPGRGLSDFWGGGEMVLPSSPPHPPTG